MNIKTEVKFSMVTILALLAVIIILGVSLHQSWQNQDALNRKIIELHKTK